MNAESQAALGHWRLLLADMRMGMVSNTRATPFEAVFEFGKNHEPLRIYMWEENFKKFRVRHELKAIWPLIWNCKNIITTEQCCIVFLIT